MPIQKFVNEDIFDDLKRKDHVVFNLPVQGSEGASGLRGYSVVAAIAERCSGFLSVGSGDLGDVISHEDEENHVWYHGIMNHCLEDGWEDEAYDAIAQGLNTIVMKHDHDMVRPVKSLWLGRGRIRTYGNTDGSIVKSIAAMANSDADISVYYL